MQVWVAGLVGGWEGVILVAGQAWLLSGLLACCIKVAIGMTAAPRLVPYSDTHGDPLLLFSI